MNATSSVKKELFLNHFCWYLTNMNLQKEVENTFSIHHSFYQVTPLQGWLRGEGQLSFCVLLFLSPASLQREHILYIHFDDSKSAFFFFFWKTLSLCHYFKKKKKKDKMINIKTHSPMMPLSLLSRVEVGLVTAP